MGEIPAFAGIGSDHSSFPRYIKTNNEQKHYIIYITVPSCDSSDFYDLCN